MALLLNCDLTSHNDDDENIAGDPEEQRPDEGEDVWVEIRGALQKR